MCVCVCVCVCEREREREREEEEEEERERIYRNMDVPWLLLPIAFPYGRSEAVCLEDRVPRESLDVDFHCEQTSPSVCGSAYS